MSQVVEEKMPSSSRSGSAPRDLEVSPISTPITAQTTDTTWNGVAAAAARGSRHDGADDEADAPRSDAPLVVRPLDDQAPRDAGRDRGAEPGQPGDEHVPVEVPRLRRDGHVAGTVGRAADGRIPRPGQSYGCAASACTKRSCASRADHVATGEPFWTTTNA